MDDLKFLMRDHYLKYASYVILDRAIPDVDDGLKPVQRRILETLYEMHDGKFHKVANAVGQTMALHPHGDAAITDALTNLANKGFLLDRQGNFGNLFTGDPAAASRYIETRLSVMSVETMFNPDLTEYLPSYDGRRKEPVVLPAKIPLLLMQGTDGIAVGMSTRILPHNFNELLEAQIAILEDRPYTLYPDFPSGGIADVSHYDKGKGKVKVRAKVEVTDPKTIVIRELCYGTTTDSLVRSIDEAAKRGKIKIESIHDYTSDKVEIEIKLARGQYAEAMLNALYAYTECEVSINAMAMVIKDNLPWDTDVHQILEYNTQRLQKLLQRELEIERDRLQEKIFEKTLEQIFIENRLYKKIEEVSSYDKIHTTIAKSLEPFHPRLERIPEHEDRERLLSIPIRRISRFDMEKNQDDIKALQDQLAQVEKNLKRVKQYTISTIKELIKKYGKNVIRKTQVTQIEEINKKEIATEKIKVGYDLESGFLGSKVKGSVEIDCTNFDKLLVINRNGTYKVINVPEKEYMASPDSPLIYVGVADKQTPFTAIYSDPKTKICFGKKFIVKQFILDKEYRYFEEGMELQHLTTQGEGEIQLLFVPKPKQKLASASFSLAELKVKGVSAKGIRINSRAVKKVSLESPKKSQIDLFEKGR